LTLSPCSWSAVLNLEHCDHMGTFRGSWICCYFQPPLHLYVLSTHHSCLFCCCTL